MNREMEGKGVEDEERGEKGWRAGVGREEKDG